MKTRKFLPATLSVLLLLILVVSCRQQPEAPFELPSPEEYRSWNKSTETLLNYPVPGHLDHYRLIYINTIGESVNIVDVNGHARYEYPEGSIIIKEVYQGLEPPQEGEEPIQLTVMIKDSQHPKAQQGWLWIVKSFEPEEVAIFERQLCVECHTNANEAHPYGDRNSANEFRDFVYFPPHSGQGETTTPPTDEYGYY